MSEGKGRGAETGTRARTRRAILDAAIVALAHDASASLADIAEAADVGRTTVHRYFPERADLLKAITYDALEQVGAASDRARLEDGPADEALVRLCEECFELGDVFMLLFSVPEFMHDPVWQDESEPDRALVRLVERGHAEGTLDRALDPLWVQNLMWALLYTAWEHVRVNGARKHDALALCVRSLRKAVRP